MTEAHKLRAAYQDAENNPDLQLFACTWPELAERINAKRNVNGHTHGIVFADFRKPTRRAENVKDIHAVAFDLDGKGRTFTLDQLREKFAGFAALVHSTKRSTPEAPRWRVILPLSAPVPALDWKFFYRAACKRFGFKPDDDDTAAESPAQAWLLPPADAIVEQLAGEIFNPASIAALVDEARWEGPPEPLLPADGAGKPYPVRSLSPLLQGATDAIVDLTQADPAVAAQAVLGAAALLAQARYDVRLPGMMHGCPTSLYLLTSTLSGEGKSSCDHFALKAITEHERAAAKQYRDDFKKHLRAQAEYQAREKEAKKEKRTFSEEAPQAPTPPFMLMNEPNVPAMFNAFENGLPSQGLFSDEGAQFLCGYAMGADHRMKTVGALCSIWSDGKMSRERVGQGISKLWGRRLSLHLMAQPKVMQTALTDEAMEAQGFLARCLMVQTPPLPALTFKPSQAIPPALAAFHRRCEELLTQELTVDGDGGLDLRLMPFSAMAAEIGQAHYDACQAMKNDEMAHIRSIAIRSPEQARRIAGVMACMEGETQITETTMLKAVELANYYLHEAARLVGNFAPPPEVRDAATLMDWFKVKQITAIDSHTLSTRGPNYAKNSTDHQILMKVLVDKGWAAVTRTTKRNGIAKPCAWRVRHG